MSEQKSLEQSIQELKAAANALAITALPYFERMSKEINAALIIDGGHLAERIGKAWQIKKEKRDE